MSTVHSTLKHNGSFVGGLVESHNSVAYLWIRLRKRHMNYVSDFPNDLPRCDTCIQRICDS